MQILYTHWYQIRSRIYEEERAMLLWNCSILLGVHADQLFSHVINFMQQLSFLKYRKM